MRPSPCRDCQDRYVGCHGKCDKYKEYREVIDKRLDKKKDTEWDYIEYMGQTLNRMSGYRKKPREL